MVFDCDCIYSGSLTMVIKERYCGFLMIIWLMRTARVTWIISVIQVF